MGCCASTARVPPDVIDKEKPPAVKEPPKHAGEQKEVDEHEPEEEDTSQCDALFAAPAGGVEDQLRELMNPDSLLRALYLCYVTHQAPPIPATPDELFEAFLDNAPHKEAVLQALVKGFGMQATHRGIDGFAASVDAYNEFRKDPATGQATNRVHNESAKKAVVRYWSEFRAHLEQRKVEAVYVLGALALFVERPCEIIFQDGRMPIRCAVHIGSWQERMSITFDGGFYRGTNEARSTDAKARIESFQGVKPAEQRRAGGLTLPLEDLAGQPDLAAQAAVREMEQHGLFQAPNDGSAAAQVSAYLQDLADHGLVNACALKKLWDPKLELTPSESLSCVLAYVKTGTNKTVLAEGANLVVVLGTTGAGKSTTINYLCGCKIVAKSGRKLGIGPTMKDVLVVQPQSEGGPKDQVVAIGYNARESMTFIPEIVEPIRMEAREPEILTLCDTPGFGDSRGPEINIANAVNRRQTFQRARSVRVLALMNFHQMMADKGKSMKSVMEEISGIFGSEDAALRHVRSIQLVITHAEAGYRLSTMKTFLSEGVPGLLAECAKNLRVVDPLEKHPDSCDRKALLKLLTRLPVISDPGPVFHTHLTDTDKVAIDTFTEPFVHEIQDTISSADYRAATEKFQALKKLKCLKHQKVDLVLSEAERKMKSAIEKLGHDLNKALVNLRGKTLSETGLRSLLKRLKEAEILDECFALETPASDEYAEAARQVESTERGMVEERDRQIGDAVHNALQRLDSDIKDVVREGTGDLFKELDILNSVQEFRLVRIASSMLPEPPSTVLPGLQAIRLACADLEAEIQKRPGLFCLFAEIDTLVTLRGEAKERLTIHLKNAVLFAARKEMLSNFDALLAEMQRCFRAVIERHHEAIVKPQDKELRSLKDKQLLVQVEAWFGVALPELVPKLREAFDWGREHLPRQLVDDLLQKLLATLDLLHEQAKKFQEQLKEDERQRKLQQLQDFIDNNTIKLEDVATHSLELNRTLQQMQEHGATTSMIQNRVDILQRRASEYASMERLERWFRDQEFQRLATLLRDCSRIQESFQGRVDVPVSKLKNKFRDLFAEERRKAVEQMKRRETLESGDLEKFTDLLRTLSREKALYSEFVKPYEDGRGVPWGDEDLQILRSGCNAFLDCAKSEKYEEAARCLVKYRRVCSLLKDGHFSQAFREHIQKLMHLGGQPLGGRRADDATFNIGQKLLQMVNKDGEHPDVRGAAREIIETFPIFSRVNVALFNKVAGGIKFDTALSRLTDLQGKKALTPEGDTRLLHCFEHVKKTYDGLMGELLLGKSEEAKRNVMDKIVQSCDALTQKIGKCPKDFSSSLADTSKMIGCIFAMWSITSSGDAYIDGDMCMIVQPHDPQVLVVLHMLGLGTGGALQNHIAQVGTGEGKSVCLGILGAFFCLLDFKVNIVCYSPFLSKRDQEKFKGLFSSFGLHPSYCDISQLCNQVLEEHCNVRQLVPKVLKQESGAWTGTFSRLASAFGTTLSSTQPSQRSILIIDEVDVFFGEDFYGRLFCPCTILQNPECVRLVEHVWQHRSENLSVEKVLAQPEAQAVRSVFKGLNPSKGVDLLEQIVAKMLHDIKAFSGNTPSHKFVVGLDEHGKQRIGYLDEVSGSVNYRSHHGFLTAFAYAHSVHNQRITDLSEKANTMGFLVSCGTLPFADLPNYFDVKLGLTGSLQSASEREMDVLKTQYHFTQFSLMPSIFEKQVVEEMPAEVVSGEAREAEFFSRIREDIIKQREKGRASLVVFEDLQRLEEFDRFLREHPFTGIEKLFRLTGEELDMAQKEERIAQAARSRHVTLITRAFGRGSDFVCRDSTLVAQGGLHVIQTFACELKSDYVQIIGRTGRQKDPGSHRQIIFLKDLARFGVHGQDGINKYEKWKGEGNGERTWNKFIDKQREEVLLKQKFETMKQRLQSSEASFSRTKQFIDKAKGEQWSDAVALLKEFQ